MYKPPPRIELPPRAELLDSLKYGLLLGLVVLAVAIPVMNHLRRAPHPVQPAAAQIAAPVPLAPARFANFRGEEASAEARQIADWVIDSGDNRQMSYVILDKRNAHVFVFDKQGELIGATPVLLGAAPGDDSVEGIGNRPIAEVRPEERTTPAGRFVAETGRNTLGEDVVWVDYNAAVSMHRVRVVDPKERRLERLASKTSADNRISYGCINMPVKFFESVMTSTFNGKRGVVYVLPEVKLLTTVFPVYDVAQKHGLKQAPCTAASCQTELTPSI